jgi:hypothetical protein
MAVTYAFTIRPASTFHCPEAAGRSIDDSAGRCGHVTYDEPLPEAVAGHWSLDPIGPKLPRLAFDGDTWSFRALLGSLAPRLEAIGIRETWAGEPTSCHQRVSGRTDYATGGPGGVEVVLDIAGAKRLRAVLEAGQRGYSTEVAGAIARADAALSVLTLSPGIRAYLEERDRSALAQAESALEALDAARAVPEEVPV